MKKIFSNDMVKHVWAQRSQPYGQNSSGSVSFNGGELVSYSTAIALHYGDFVLRSRDTFSPTTGRHMPSRYDVQVPVIVCELFSWEKRYHGKKDFPKGPVIKKAILEKCFELAKSYALRKADSTRALDIHRIDRELESLRFICNRFNLVYPAGYETPREVLGETEAAIKRLANKAKREKLKANKLRKARFEDAREQFECWLAGDVIHFPREYHQGNEYYLTVRDNRVLTSGNAEAPTEHVKRAFALYDRVIKSGEAWTKNGESCKLGHFELDAIDTHGNAKAGCHLFKAAELARFRAQWRY